VCCFSVKLVRSFVFVDEVHSMHYWCFFFVDLAGGGFRTVCGCEWRGWGSGRRGGKKRRCPMRGAWLCRGATLFFVPSTG